MAANMIGSGTPWRLAYNPGVPLSLSIWVYGTDTSGTQQNIFSYQNTAGSQFYRLYLIGTTGQVICDSADPAFTSGSGGFITMNAWNHIAFVFGNPCRCAVNGGSWSNGGTGIFPSVSVMRMGARQNATTPQTFTDYFTGRTAELGMWNGDIYLTNTSWHLPMANKRCPLFLPIDQSSGFTLTRYWPLWASTAADRMVGTPAWSVPTGTAYGDHCPQIYNASGMGGARMA